MKIAVCVPHYGDVKAGFALSLANMIARTASARISEGAPGPTIRVFMAGGAHLVANRSALAAGAREWAADQILWLDSDHTFPSDALIRLLRHKLPVVGCNYAQRGHPTAPVAARLASDGSYSRIWTTKEDAEAGRIEPVAFLGLGFCLMRADVLDGLTGSLFQPPIGPDGELAMGEDVYFFKRLREAGVGIFVDHALSWAIGHIWEDTRRLSDALAEREAWWSQHRKQEGRAHVDSIFPAAGAEQR